MTNTDIRALVVLPPPSPALRAHMAAAKLRDAAQKAQAELASNDYWGGNWKNGMEDGMGGAGGTLAGLLSPGLALDLADLLDTAGHKAAQRVTVGGDPDLPEHFTAIVDKLLEP